MARRGPGGSGEGGGGVDRDDDGRGERWCRALDIGVLDVNTLFVYTIFSAMRMSLVSRDLNVQSSNA